MRTVIDKYSDLPFSYGQDCCQFVGECISSYTGVNPMDGLTYATELGAYRIVKRHGDLEGAMRHYLGEPYEGYKDGDACIMDNNAGRDLAAVIYKGEVIGRVKSGLMNYPLSRARLIWCT